MVLWASRRRHQRATCPMAQEGHSVAHGVLLRKVGARTAGDGTAFETFFNLNRLVASLAWQP